MYREVIPANYPPPEDSPKQPDKGISINIQLAGYEKIKAQLNDIESQTDRILNKVKELDKLSRNQEPPPEPELGKFRTRKG